MKHYSIINKTGEAIAVNLADECCLCIKNCSSPGKVIEVCPKYGMKRRQGMIENTRGTTFLCCDETKTTKLFRNKLEGLSYAYFDLQIPKTKIELDAKTNEQQRVNRLVHNLTSINAHNIQEIYDLVPQEMLASNYQTQVDFIQTEIKRDIRKAALMFLRIAKHNIHMKSEFSIYRKLDRSDAVIELRSHQIQKVILNVLHSFFVDFTNKRIFVDVESYLGKVNIDYETIQVALYHLIENASKYAKNDTVILIEFQDYALTVDVVFTMTSLFIEEAEIEKIFIEGYSGKAAKQSHLSGDGIGMWRINQMMKLNKGYAKIINGKAKNYFNGLPYGQNEIILNFVKTTVFA